MDADTALTTISRYRNRADPNCSTNVNKMAKANKPRSAKQARQQSPQHTARSITAGQIAAAPKRPAKSASISAWPAIPASKRPAPANQPKAPKQQPVAAPLKPPAKATPKPPRLHAVRPSGSKDDSFFDLVHAIARQIPRGRVTTYGAIAVALGTKGSSRMVGWALISGHHAQPFVPCHRVVNRTGLLTGRHHYTPPEQMQQLLEAEGIKVKDSQVVDFKKLFWDPSAEL